MLMLLLLARGAKGLVAPTTRRTITTARPAAAYAVIVIGGGHAGCEAATAAQDLSHPVHHPAGQHWHDLREQLRWRPLPDSWAMAACEARLNVLLAAQFEGGKASGVDPS